MYTVYLADKYGYNVAFFNDISDLKITLVTNNISTFALSLPITAIDYIEENAFITVIRKGKPIITGLIRAWDSFTDIIDVVGVDFNHILDSRIIAYSAGSTEAAKSDYADDVIKELVNENMGSSATTARQLTTYLTVEGDQSLAQTIDRAFAWRNVLDVCQDLALESEIKGTRLYFGVDAIIGNGIELTFKTRINQWGSDRSLEGSTPTVFGETFGNLEGYVETYNYRAHYNAIYVGGQGLGDDRLVVEVDDTTALARNPFARRERFAPRTAELSSTALTGAGQRELKKYAYKNIFSGSLMDTPATQFNFNWFWGDKVAVIQNKRTLNGNIDAVTISYREGTERVSALVRGNL